MELLEFQLKLIVVGNQKTIFIFFRNVKILKTQNQFQFILNSCGKMQIRRDGDNALKCEGCAHASLEAVCSHCGKKEIEID